MTEKITVSFEQWRLDTEGHMTSQLRQETLKPREAELVLKIAARYDLPQEIPFIPPGDRRPVYRFCLTDDKGIARYLPVHSHPLAHDTCCFSEEEQQTLQGIVQRTFHVLQRLEAEDSGVSFLCRQYVDEGLRPMTGAPLIPLRQEQSAVLLEAFCTGWPDTAYTEKGAVVQDIPLYWPAGMYHLFLHKNHADATTWWLAYCPGNAEMCQGGLFFPAADRDYVTATCEKSQRLEDVLHFLLR